MGRNRAAKPGFHYTDVMGTGIVWWCDTPFSPRLFLFHQRPHTQKNTIHIILLTRGPAYGRGRRRRRRRTRGRGRGGEGEGEGEGEGDTKG